MDEKKKKPLWSTPWKYSESFLVGIGIYLVGLVLQISVGAFQFSHFAFPVNIIISCTGLLIVFLLGLFKNNSLFQWLASVQLSISLITILLFQALIMGITPQLNGPLTHKPAIVDILGFTLMTRSWPFILIYYFLLLSLFATTVNRLKHPRWKDYGFYINHIGIFIFLYAAGIGATDLRRHVMYVEEKADAPEWRVYNDKNEVLELPIAIYLHDFKMEEYAPKIAIINSKSGKAIPYSNPNYFQLGEITTKTKIDDWEIKIDTFIQNAVRNSDRTYREIDMPGSSPAARITVIDLNTKKKKSGWICCGNYAQLYMPLTLNKEYSVVMTRPEAKHFQSIIDVYTKDGNKATTSLEVNKPFTVGDWTIYQYGYDNDAGKSSSYSSFELVYDPWLKIVYLGIFLCAIGSIFQMFMVYKKRKEDKI